MKLIVISRSSIHNTEWDTVRQLFERGLQIFHLRKPHASSQQVEEYLNEIPERFRNRIVLHSKHHLAGKYKLKGIHLNRYNRRNSFKTWMHVKYLKLRYPSLVISTSFHSLETLIESKTQYEYVFLSPIFNSISKTEYKSQFNHQLLSTEIKKVTQNVIALGGVAEDNLDQVQKMGFYGAAVLGAIWTEGDAVADFMKIKEKWENLNLVSA